MQLRLSWTDPASQRLRRPLLSPPIALGQTFEAMPAAISGKSVSRMVISDRQISDFQALLVEIEGDIYLIDNGGQTCINQQQISGQERLTQGDRIRIGQTELQLQLMDAPSSSPSQGSTHLQTIPAPVIEPESATPNRDRPIAPLEPLGNADSPSSVIPPSGGSSKHHLNGHARSEPPLSRPELFGNDLSRNGFSRNGLSPDGLSPNIEPLPTTNGHAPSNGLARPAEDNGLPTAPPPASKTPPAPQISQAPTQRPTSPTQIPKQSNIHQPFKQANSAPPSGCRRIVGFLLKRPCGRATNIGCNHCAKGYSNHAYSADYDLYEGFGRFEPGEWGYDLLENQSKT